MRYAIKQKAISIGDDFTIKDERGDVAYIVDGHAFGRTLDVYNRQKQRVAVIKRKFFTFSPSYKIIENGLLAATVTKRRFSFRHRFLVDVPGPADYDVIGSFHHHEYTFTKNRREVATVSKRFFATTDSYGVEIAGGDTLVILCTAIIIDLVLHAGR